MSWAHGCALRHGSTSTKSSHDGATAPEARAELRRATRAPTPRHSSFFHSLGSKECRAQHRKDLDTLHGNASFFQPASTHLRPDSQRSVRNMLLVTCAVADAAHATVIRSCVNVLLFKRLLLLAASNPDHYCASAHAAIALILPSCAAYDCTAVGVATAPEQLS